MNKLQLRTHFRSLRQSLPLKDRKQAECDCISLLKKSSLFQQAHHIACYLAHKSELTTFHIIQLIWQHHKLCYLPVLGNEERQLYFMPYHQNDELKKNQYGIYEPTIKDNALDPRKLDLVFVPLVAFDKSGARLGTGGGYYDYTFAFKKKDPKPLLLGLAFSLQEAVELPHENWDIKLDGVLTEKQILLF